MAALRIGVVDTGVNPWHSHVRGRVTGCRVHLGRDGKVEEDSDFSDSIGHGTAVAGVIREAFPDAEIFAVRVFDTEEFTYPTLIARGILRAAAERCAFINLSVAVPPGPGDALVSAACAAALAARCVLVAAVRPDRPDWLPASVPGVHAVSVDETLACGEVLANGPLRLAAPGRARDLRFFARESNFAGHSFACARALVHLARQRLAQA
ncbi:MAG TPA: S8/S53 family peptidase [Casimicrobiaceae bacterium]